MTRWNSRYAAGARLIAVPGWPLPAFSTASIASTRIVSTARRSRSDQSSWSAHQRSVLLARRSVRRLLCDPTRPRWPHTPHALGKAPSGPASCPGRLSRQCVRPE